MLALRVVAFRARAAPLGRGSVLGQGPPPSLPAAAGHAGPPRPPLATVHAPRRSMTSQAPRPPQAGEATPPRHDASVSRRALDAAVDASRRLVAIDLSTLRKRFYMLPRPGYLVQWVRPRSFDDLVAVFSWTVMGSSFLLVVGTTTCVSLLLAVANTVWGQGMIAGRVSDYVSREMGIKIAFENAIVPNWRERSILFKGVKVTRSEANMHPEQLRVTAQFDVDIDEMEVKLSLARLFAGKGLLRECHLRGVKGVVDYRKLEWDGQPYAPRVARWGDLELEHAQFEDVHLTIKNRNFRDNTVSLVNLETGRLRQQWLLYDVLNARTITGTFDNALFSVHARLREDSGPNDVGITRTIIKLVGMPFDNLNNNTSGPISWIKDGVVDLSFVVDFPNVEKPLTTQATKNADAGPFERVINIGYDIVHYLRELSGSLPMPAAAEQTVAVATPYAAAVENESVQLTMTMKLRNLRATVPLQEGKWGYIDTTMIRPIVAFMNSHSTQITVENCRFELPLSKFEGTFDIWSCGLVGAMSQAVYDEFLKQVQDEQIRTRRLKRVGLWSVRSLSRSLVQLIDHMSLLRFASTDFLLFM